MNVRPSSRHLLAFAMVTLPVALAACGRVPGQFEILNDQVPEPGCIIPVNPGIYMGRAAGHQHRAVRDFISAYFFFPLIENNLPLSRRTLSDPERDPALRFSGRHHGDPRGVAARFGPGGARQRGRADPLSGPLVRRRRLGRRTPLGGGVAFPVGWPQRWFQRAGSPATRRRRPAEHLRAGDHQHRPAYDLGPVPLPASHLQRLPGRQRRALHALGGAPLLRQRLQPGAGRARSIVAPRTAA